MTNTDRSTKGHESAEYFQQALNIFSGPLNIQRDSAGR
jgi:hypothetical protein